ncbi:MAG TPA: hypothetical protein VJ746_03955 [Nitrospira sp.]|nr:hypothetical protein [Nitrospira sp.]
MRVRSRFKFALAWALGAWDVSGISSIPLAIAMAIGSIGLFLWACYGELENVRIQKVSARANSVSTEDFNRIAKIIIMTSITLGYGLALIFLYGVLWYREKLDQSVELGIYISRFHVSTENNAVANIDTHRLLRFKEDNRIVMACRKDNANVDPLDDKNIAKSEAFEIRDDDFWIETHLPPDILDPKPLIAQSFTCHLLLVPRILSSHDISTIREVKEKGGRLLQSQGGTYFKTAPGVIPR